MSGTVHQRAGGRHGNPSAASEPASLRRARLAPGTSVGVTERMICDLVHVFYAKVRLDKELGPTFERVVGPDWDAHLAKLCDFWSSVLLMTGRFKGAPMDAHIRIAELRPAHFVRWLTLFNETAEEVCPAPAAALFKEKADLIARSLQLGIAASRGELIQASAPSRD